ncbi:5' exonuclease Apollo like protein [Argiope bruennichi]|uniref:5' exonuclease Apollo n=1 Tax=Argiope bruennichi TaxID=94029 RepID=A0A8T0E612_ARGBR|nr:5' exonuclease Apollo like protein [Argiope bruennichi]
MLGNGHAIPGTPIAIDMWNIKSYPQTRIFFLSHFHADHIVGLNSSWKYPIYTSPITAKFLIRNLKINPDLVRSLEIGEDHLIPIDQEGQEMITVTLFDANHCPGSVMFLLSGYFGDILYTGDFRFRPNLLDGFELPPIDVLYLDNTYCSPSCIFPTRDDAIENVLSQLSVCLVQSERVYLGLDNLGKEELLQRIAKERQCKINVYPSRKNIMDILEMSDIVTTDKSNTKIFVVPTNQINGKNIVKWNNEMKTHAILATARFCGFKFKPFSKCNDIHVIPYSNHSSYYEIKEFVKLVRPRSIVPIVSRHAKGLFGTDISDRADMIARPEHKPWRRPLAVGVRYIVSEDSETDSDPDAIHIEPEEFIGDDIAEYSSPGISEESEPEISTQVWEITHVTGKALPTIYYIQES